MRTLESVPLESVLKSLLYICIAHHYNIDICAMRTFDTVPLESVFKS